MPSNTFIAANTVHQITTLSDTDLILVVTDPTTADWKLQAITVANLRALLANP